MNKEEKNAAPAAEAPERGKLFTSRNIAWFAILLALTVVLQIWGSAIRIGANTVNLSLIPVVLAAILLGPLGGAVTGFVSGAVVLVYVILGAEPLSLMMFQDHPFITVALVLVKGTAAGVAAGLIYKALQKTPLCGNLCGGSRRARRQYGAVYPRRAFDERHHRPFGLCGRHVRHILSRRRRRWSEFSHRIRRQYGGVARCLFGHKSR